MKAFDEWHNLVSSLDNIYIYGAGKVAVKIADLLDYSGKKGCLKGYIVSSKSGNPDDIKGVPVLLPSEVVNKRVAVLVSLSDVYHPEIFETLTNLGFCPVIPAHKYFSIEIEKAHSGDHDYAANIDESVRLSSKLSVYRMKMMDKYFSFSHAFGGNGFYQSFPKLGIKGTRNTAIRIEKYGLNDYVKPESTVLDIGCNIGFLDIEISGKVKSILGLEYSETLVEIGNETAKAIGTENVKFISGDYNEWQKQNTLSFDIIFSFAVHAWLNVRPEIYANQIVDMLNVNGIVIFESQQLSTDKMFSAFVEALVSEKLQVLKDEIINDDGETDRKFIVMKKCHENK